MRLTYLSENFAVSPQIYPQDIPKLAEEGIKTIICNRPDNEESSQPSSEELFKKARHCGIDFFALPIPKGKKVPSLLTKRAYEILKKDHPHYLAFCGTGQRAKSLWNSVQEKELSKEE